MERKYNYINNDNKLESFQIRNSYKKANIFQKYYLRAYSRTYFSYIGKSFRTIFIICSSIDYSIFKIQRAGILKTSFSNDLAIASRKDFQGRIFKEGFPRKDFQGRIFEEGFSRKDFRGRILRPVVKL
ncbi:hypothetical protein PSF70_08900 [Methanosarcina mazei]|nr:hypothetical protein PSF70_08900 [Methanosarcina mazei]